MCVYFTIFFYTLINLGCQFEVSKHGIPLWDLVSINLFGPSAFKNHTYFKPCFDLFVKTGSNAGVYLWNLGKKIKHLLFQNTSRRRRRIDVENTSCVWWDYFVYWNNPNKGSKDTFIFNIFFGAGHYMLKLLKVYNELTRFTNFLISM